MPINLNVRFIHAPAQHQQPPPTPTVVLVEPPRGPWF